MRASFNRSELLTNIDTFCMGREKMVEQAHGGVDALDREIMDGSKSRRREIKGINRVVEELYETSNGRSVICESLTRPRRATHCLQSLKNFEMESNPPFKLKRVVWA